MRFALLSLPVLLLLAGCTSRASVPNEPAAVVVEPAATAQPAALSATPAIEDVPSAQLEDQLDTASNACSPDERPVFLYGFATLSKYLGSRMGEPTTCERTSIETGDSLQQTTRGVARYLKADNVPTFTSGVEHWALTQRGLVYWIGRSVEVADDAQPVGVDSEHRAAAAAVEVAATPAPAGAPVPMTHAGPDWLQRPLDLIGEYDRRHGTILDKTIEKSNIAVVAIPGAWAAYVPKAKTITLDPALQTESPEALATVLAHEAQHAVDTQLNGKNKSDPEVMCYTWEISAFRLQAAVWQSFYGDTGKANPGSDLEQELNQILAMARGNSWQFMSTVRERYRDECL